VERAKADGSEFAHRVDERQIDLADTELGTFFHNIISRNPNLTSMQLFKTTFEEQEYEEALARLANFNVTCPTELLFELTRTPEERKGWLEVLRQQKEEELKTQDCVLRRFQGEYGSWNVGGPPSVDATAFTVDHDIWMTGLGMGNGYSTGDSASIQDIEILSGTSTRGAILYRHPETVTSTWDGSEDNKYFKVQFTEPVKLLKHTNYTIRIQYSLGNDIWAAGETISNTIGEVNFTFSAASCDGGDNDNNGDTTTAGPTRDIYFALAEVTL
jgi:hypothetical protein